jgi:putative SOS response-associated peptidase YedK
MKSCTMIIKSANDFVGEVHDRMPVILEREYFQPWLNGTAGLELAETGGERRVATLACVEAGE